MTVRIQAVFALQILDSRGRPTVRCWVRLSDGSSHCADVPSGASTGSFEACEKRDNRPEAYHGKGVDTVVAAINEQLAPKLAAEDPCAQAHIDTTLCALDGSAQKTNLGANALLGISLAVARAGAHVRGMPLYRYVSTLLGESGALGGADRALPTPMCNMINGGMHADNPLSIQEFMVVPARSMAYREQVRCLSEVYTTLKAHLLEAGCATSVGDEGGFAPQLAHDEAALTALVVAGEKTGYRPGEDFSIALDVAMSEIVATARAGQQTSLPHHPEDHERILSWFADLAQRFPITSIEDPCHESDTDFWRKVTARLGPHLQIVGDDLYVTNKERLAQGIAQKLSNAILIKPNQVGTLSETLDTIRLAQKARYNTVISHRSGDTEDTFIADLAVGAAAPYIKTGAVARSERTSKYNRLLEIAYFLERPE